MYQNTIDDWTEISIDDAINYGILGRYGDKTLEKTQCAILFLKPDNKSLKKSQWDAFCAIAKGRCCAYENRLGSMERSIIVGLELLSDAVLFKLTFVGKNE